MPTAAAVKTKARIIAVLVILTGGWMAFDGAHAFVTGDYVTPGSGEHVGQLGPWAAIPRSLGVDPRSAGVKAVFVVFGLSYLAALGAFLRGHVGSIAVLASFAALALLYLPFGTLASTAVLALLASLRRGRVLATHG